MSGTPLVFRNTGIVTPFLADAWARGIAIDAGSALTPMQPVRDRHGGLAKMDDQQHRRNQRNSHTPQRPDGVLPLAIRQRLWDQLWSRLLTPPVDPADRAPAPRERNAQDGGSR